MIVRCAQALSATKILKERTNLDIIINSVEDLEVQQGEVNAVILKSGEKLQTKSVVLTTGTFLSGMILLGKDRIPAGRVGEEASYGLSQTLKRACHTRVNQSHFYKFGLYEPDFDF